MKEAQHRLQRFVQKVLELNGAIVDHLHEDALEALLPIELAGKHGFREHEKFHFDPEQQGTDGILLSDQTEQMETFYRMLEGRGYTGRLQLPDIYLKQSGFKEMIESAFTFSNGIYRYLGAREQVIPYVFVNYLFTAISEEKKEGIIQQGINALTLCGIDWQPDTRSEVTENPPETPDAFPQAVILERAGRLARRRTTAVFGDFTKKLQWRLDRDIERLRDYYGTIVEEIKHKIKSRGLDGPERQKEIERITATGREFKAKVAAQTDRYALNIELKPINVLIVWVRVMTLSLQIQRRQAVRAIETVWNPYTKELEPLGCESCLTPGTVFTLCDDKVHLLCKTCALCRTCGKFHCQACSPDKCPRCGAKLK